MSDKDLKVAPHYIRLKNPKTNKSMDFEMVWKDMDQTEEDIYDYRYESKDKKYKLLLIND
jgi:hypothetical protein